MGGIAGDERELRRRFGGFGGGPDDVWGFDGSMGEMINGGEFGDIEDEAVVGELTHFVGVEIFSFETAAGEFEAV